MLMGRKRITDEEYSNFLKKAGLTTDGKYQNGPVKITLSEELAKEILEEKTHTV